MNNEFTRMSMKTAAIIISSNDIIQNRKNDNVSNYLIQELNYLQYTVEKVVIVPEKVNVISNELEFMVKHNDIIIAVARKCSVLHEAIGRITGQLVEVNDELIKLLEELQEKYEEEEIRIPSQAKIMTGNGFPVIYLQRIFILKEEHCEKCFNDILKKHLTEYREERYFEKTIYVVQNGNKNTDLSDFVNLKDNLVKIDFSRDENYFIFKIASMQLSHIVEFEKKLKHKFSSYCLNSIDNTDVWRRVYTSNEQHIRNAFEHIENCLKEYGPENVFISFNGGKDCTVLLHMVLTVIKNKYPNYTQPVFCLYVQSCSPFPEQDEFITLCQEYYNLKVMTIKSGIKEALRQTLIKFPHYKACFMGTRRTDPYSSDLNVCQMTDPNWPQILRVSPLLDWHYSDVWDYLLFYKVPYCKLYDMGYTSLGNTTNTTKNPSLIYYDHFYGNESYLPAYKLLTETKERNGRSNS